MTLRILPAGLLALVLVLGACGDDDGDGEDTGTPTESTAAESSSDDTGSVGGTDDSGSSGDALAVAVSDTDLGEVLVDGEGLTLYIFTNDSDGTPTCTGDCAATWPPLLVEELPEGVEGVDDGVLGVVDDGAGGQQLTAGGQPVYLYAGDGAPGDVNGHGVGGVWFAVGADGTPIEGDAGEGAGGDSGY